MTENYRILEEKTRQLLLDLIKGEDCKGPCQGQSIVNGEYLDSECPIFSEYCRDFLIERRKVERIHDAGTDLIIEDWSKKIKEAAPKIYLDIFGEESLFEELL